MEAPRDIVLQRLLQAHRTRLSQLLTDYDNTLKKTAVITGASTGAGAGAGGVSSAVTASGKDSLSSTNVYLGLSEKAQVLHEAVVGSLVEVCRGISELFDETTDSDRIGTTPHTGSDDSNRSTPRNITESKDKQLAIEQLKALINESYMRYEGLMKHSLILFLQYAFACLQESCEADQRGVSGSSGGGGGGGGTYKAESPLVMSSRTPANPFDDDEEEGSLSQAELHQRIINQGSVPLPNYSIIYLRMRNTPYILPIYMYYII